MHQKEAKKRFLPSSRCIFCNKKIDEIGGVRIIRHQKMGIICSAKGVSDDLGKEYKVGRFKKLINQTIKLDDKTDRYLIVWGANDIWCKSAIEKARIEFLKEYYPWFCQICSGHKFKICGSFKKYVQGSIILRNDGTAYYTGLNPLLLGCSNPDCENNKEKFHFPGFNSVRK